MQDWCSLPLSNWLRTLRHLAYVEFLRKATISSVRMKILSWCYLFEFRRPLVLGC